MSARLLALVLLALPETRESDPALTLADLAAYRAALSGARDTPAPPVPVTFRALWEHPERFQGRRVEVSGRIERLFRQGPIGDFPALEQAWAVSPAFDPFCLVYPKPQDGRGPRYGATVRFSGTFLKVVRYQGGDGPRLAPLIVGDRPPDAAPETTALRPVPATRIDWMVGIGAALVVALALARQHLRRPPRAQRDAARGSHPEFISPGDDSESPAAS